MIRPALAQYDSFKGIIVSINTEYGGRDVSNYNAPYFSVETDFDNVIYIIKILANGNTFYVNESVLNKCFTKINIKEMIGKNVLFECKYRRNSRGAYDVIKCTLLDNDKYNNKIDTFTVSGIILNARPQVFGTSTAIFINLQRNFKTFMVRKEDAVKFGIIKAETATGSDVNEISKQLEAVKGMQVNLTVEYNGRVYWVKSLEKVNLH